MKKANFKKLKCKGYSQLVDKYPDIVDVYCMMRDCGYTFIIGLKLNIIGNFRNGYIDIGNTTFRGYSVNACFVI